MPREEYNEVMEEPEVPFDTDYYFTSDYCKECDLCFACIRAAKEINITTFAMNPDIKCERKSVSESVLKRLEDGVDRK
ncbi:MAG: hypothetical protein WC554_06095 [Clostridia bacterium]|jgi:hypothetical protein